MNVMPISEIIEKVTMMCKKNNVKRLDLFGSFATGTATPTSDIDFVVYGCDNLMQLEDDLLIKRSHRGHLHFLSQLFLVKHSIFSVSIFTFTTLHI